MLTIEEIGKLKKEANYRGIIKGVPRGELRQGVVEDDEKLLEVGWVHHQLGEYDMSVPIMEDLYNRYSAVTMIGESARRGLAHGLLQGKSLIGMADSVMQEISPSLARDNVRMNMFIMAARKGMEIPASEVMAMITNALQVATYTTVNGHIVNNGALVLHEARKQEGVKPYLPILPGLIEAAIGIYEATNTPKNHIAGAMFRASQIFEAADWKRGASLVAEESVALWKELVSSQDGARYQRNLEGAQAQLDKLTK